MTAKRVMTVKKVMRGRPRLAPKVPPAEKVAAVAAAAVVAVAARAPVPMGPRAHRVR